MDKRRIGGAVVAFIGLAIANELVVRVFDWLWQLVANNGEITATAISNIVGLAAIGVGLYLIFSGPNTKQAKMDVFVERLEKLNRTLGFIEHGTYQPSRNSHSDILSAFHSLYQLGIPVPDESGMDTYYTHKHAMTFVPAILPLVRDGHLKEARRRAPEIIESFNATPLRYLPLYERVWPLSLAFSRKTAS